MGTVLFIKNVSIYVKGIYIGSAKKALVSINNISKEFIINVDDAILVLCSKRLKLLSKLHSRCTLTYTLNQNKFSVNAVNTTFETTVNYKTESCQFSIEFRGKSFNLPKPPKPVKIF